MKISAHGATQVAKISGTLDGERALLVLTSTGRILRRWPGLSTTYGLLATITKPENRTRDTLVRCAEKFGYTGIKDAR